VFSPLQTNICNIFRIHLIQSDLWAKTSVNGIVPYGFIRIQRLIPPQRENHPVLAG